VTLLVKSRKAIISVFQTLIIIMTMLSGGFMPVDGLLAKIGLFTVNHWASDSILRIMLDSGTQDVLRNIAVLGMIAAGLLLVSFGAYRKVGYRE
jgi:ABC-2 type transport system permease protein